jgi:DNA-binding response OmpR family regulator
LLIAKGLREQSFAVDVSADGEHAAHQAYETNYDAIILDVMLPKRDGLTVCRQIRARGAVTPILLLTALDAVEARIAGLDSGADDHLTKPFASVNYWPARAIVRRGTRPIVPEILTVADPIDTRAREATRDARSIRLTAREYALLEPLRRRPARSSPGRKLPNTSGTSNTIRFRRD